MLVRKFFRSFGFCSLAMIAASSGFQTAWAQQPAPSKELAHRLEEFGPISSAVELQSTWKQAVDALRQTGGLLVVPPALWTQLKPLSLQGLERKPAAPAETKGWSEGGGVTVVSADKERVLISVPPLTGMKIERNFTLDQGDSAPHWGTHPMLQIDSKLIYGSVSYLDWLQKDVQKGPDKRFYVPTIRGLHIGQFLNIHGSDGYGGGVTRACVKEVGYDPEQKMSFIVADTSIDHKAGAIVHNKSNSGIIHMTQTSNADNQTYDVKVIRNQYAHGDTYIYYCDFNYMSNVHSAAGDENGNCYSAFIRSMDNNFQGTIESVDWANAQVTFANGARNIETLGDSRPLINRNPSKAITAGKVRIVPAECYWDAIDTGKCKFEGKTWPTKLVKNEVTGVAGLKMGGLIRGDKDCPWTDDVVGRYFAVDEKTERTPQGNLRWYLITAFKQNADGTKEIEIQRFWWGAKSAGSPTLYRHDSYTVDGHDKPLGYLIAPGTYVNDVSQALAESPRGNQRKLGLAAYRHQGSPADYAPGDAVEQAIGPDPFKPQVFRAWMWEDVPGPWPSTVFDLANHGAASRYSVMTVAGGPATLDMVEQRHETKPAWDNIIVMNSAAGVGLNLKGDFSEAAMLLHQPSKEQAIKWLYGHAEGKAPSEATLTVDRTSGEFKLDGAGVRTVGPVSEVAGLSGDKTPARNLRGKNVPVTAAATKFEVAFPQAEADGDYAVFIEQTWLTNRAIIKKTAAGFTVEFATAAPADAKLDWMIVR